jgi:hypothetical protein
MHHFSKHNPNILAISGGSKSAVYPRQTAANDPKSCTGAFDYNRCKKNLHNKFTRPCAWIAFSNGIDGRSLWFAETAECSPDWPLAVQRLGRIRRHAGDWPVAGSSRVIACDREMAKPRSRHLSGE